MRIPILLSVFLSACAPALMNSSLSSTNKDVLILAVLAQYHLIKTDGRDINLIELLQTDTLNRIFKSFESFEFKSKGGYISLHYKFAHSRNSNDIEVNKKENEQTKIFRWKQKAIKNQYDGEIQFDYGERFYRVKKINIYNQ